MTTHKIVTHIFDERYIKLIAKLNNTCKILCNNHANIENTNIFSIDDDNEIVTEYISTLMTMHEYQCNLYDEYIPYACFNFISLIEFKNYDKIIEDCTHKILSIENIKPIGSSIVIKDILCSIKFNKIKKKLEISCQEYNAIYDTITEDAAYDLIINISLLAEMLNNLDYIKSYDKKPVLIVFSSLIEQYVTRIKIISIFFKFYPLSEIDKITNKILTCTSKSNKRFFITSLFIAINQTALKISLEAIQNLVYENFSNNLHNFYKLEGLFKSIYSIIDDRTNITHKNNIPAIIDIILYRENCYNIYKRNKIFNLFLSLSNHQDYTKAIDFNRDDALSNKEALLTHAIAFDEELTKDSLAQDISNLRYQNKLKEKLNKYINSLSDDILTIAGDKLEICFLLLNTILELNKTNNIKSEIIATTLFIHNNCERNIDTTEQYINNVISKLKDIDSSFMHEVFTILKIINHDDSIHDITFAVLLNEVLNMINLCNLIAENIIKDMNNNDLEQIEERTKLNIKHSRETETQYKFLLDACNNLDSIKSTNLKSNIIKMNISNKFAAHDEATSKIFKLNKNIAQIISSPNNHLTYSYNSSSINYLSPQHNNKSLSATEPCSASKKIKFESVIDSLKIEL